MEDLDVPVFSIMFGDANQTQLDSLAELTRARVFDGKTDLIGAFKNAKGYN
jgi:Ca-activated chloride channel family protein